MGVWSAIAVREGRLRGSALWPTPGGRDGGTGCNGCLHSQPSALERGNTSEVCVFVCVCVCM